METIKSWEELLDPTVEEPIYTTVQVGNKIVRLASLTSAAEVLAYIDRQNSGTYDKTENMLQLIADCLVNDEGERIGNIKELAKLAKKNTATLLKLRDAAMAVNGLALRAEQRKNDSSGVESSALPTGTATNEA